MSLTRQTCRGVIVATITLFCPGLTVAENPGTGLPLVNLQLAGNGDLLGWKVGNLADQSYELIEPGKVLLKLKLLVQDRNVADEFQWRRLKSDPNSLGEFIGTHDNLGLEIYRSYHAGVQQGSLVHRLSVSALSDTPPVLAQIRLTKNLRRHTADDGWLGDLFYGYDRVFAASNGNLEFKSIRENQSARAGAVSARHVAVVISPEELGDNKLELNPETGVTSSSGASKDQQLILEAVKLQGNTLIASQYSGLLYADMSGPIRILARLIERVMQLIATLVGNGGLAIIVFALLVRTVLLPVNLWSIRQQRLFAATQLQMKPKIEQINSTLKGSKKSEAILETYKSHGISPFSGLKGSVALFVQLPILIALFAVTTESALFRDASFLWISDLSLPDRAVSLPFSIPAFRNSINVLPILLGAVTVGSALIQAHFQKPGAASSLRSGLLLALIFVIFFYPCAAAIVLYWTVVNVSQIIESTMTR